MTRRFVRAPNASLLIAAGVALILLAMLNAGMAVPHANNYRIEMVVALAIGVLRNATLGMALLFVAIRRSQFAGATAVIVATFLIFGVALNAFASLAFSSVDLSWWSLIDLAIAAAILWPSLFPWSLSANRPILFLIASTFGALSLIGGSLAMLARL